MCSVHGNPLQAELMLLVYDLSRYIMVYLLVVLLMMCDTEALPKAFVEVPY